MKGCKKEVYAIRSRKKEGLNVKEKATTKIPVVTRHVRADANG